MADLDINRSGCEQVAPNVYVYMTGNQGPNATFVVGSDGVLLVDSLMTLKQSAKLKAAIAEVTPLPVTTLVYSHYHGDHVLGAEVFAPVPTVIASITAAEFLRTMGESFIPLYATWRRTPQDAEDVLAIKLVVRPTIGIESEAVVFVDDIEVQLKRTGMGHSPSDVRVFLPQDGILITGDLLSYHGVPGMRDARTEGWLQRLDDMYNLNPAVIIPGHGQWSNDREIITIFREFLAAAWDTASTGFAGGKTVDELMETVDTTPWADFHGMKRYHEVLGRMYEELRGAPSKYDIALSERRAQLVPEHRIL